MALLLCISSFSTNTCGVITNDKAKADLEKVQKLSNTTMENSLRSDGYEFIYENGLVKEIYINGRMAVENSFTNGVRTVKQGVDYCEFTYNSERDITSEVRNGKLITYLYKEQDNSIYLTLNGFNYEGADYYYTKDKKGRIDGITNSDGELIAKYEYDANGYKVENVLSKVGDKWVNNSDEKFIGNINRIRDMSSYFDIETGLYYQNAVFYDAKTGAVIQ